VLTQGLDRLLHRKGQSLQPLTFQDGNMAEGKEPMSIPSTDEQENGSRDAAAETGFQSIRHTGFLWAIKDVSWGLLQMPRLSPEADASVESSGNRERLAEDLCRSKLSLRLTVTDLAPSRLAHASEIASPRHFLIKAHCMALVRC
jgi:hypothetical protein